MLLQRIIINIISKSINVKTASRKALEERIMYLNKVVMSLKMKLEEYKKKEEFRLKNAAENETIVNLQKEITLLNQELQEQTDSYNNLYHKNDILKEEIKKKNKRIMELEVNYNYYQNEKKNNEQVYTAKESVLNDLNNEIKKIREENEKLRMY